MPKYSGDDYYIDRESGVLKNLLGITGEALLEAAEADFAAERSRELCQTPLGGRLDLEHLQAIHRYLFGDVYEWAGQLRNIDISKGGNLFAHHAYIASAAAPIFNQLAEEKRLAGLAPAAFSDRAAHYLGELNALHPFREGNGRAQREFIESSGVRERLLYRVGKHEPGRHAPRINKRLQRRHVKTRRAYPNQSRQRRAGRIHASALEQAEPAQAKIAVNLSLPREALPRNPATQKKR